MVVIVISGKPGAGSTTISKLLARKLRLGYFSPGDYFKKYGHGKETKKAIDFWLKKKGSSGSFHKNLDKIQKNMARRGNAVICGKLSIRMLKGYYDFSVWLTAPKSVRAKRYAKRDKIPYKEAMRQLVEKEKLERKNWLRIYRFDYFNQEKEADLVINVPNKTPKQIVDLIASKIKRVFIVHRWEGRLNKDWYPYVKQELEKKGYTVDVPAMPNPDLPNTKEWVAHLRKSIGTPNESTFLVGHSAGVITILRYLEQLPIGSTIGGCVIVAGWVDDLGYKELENFFTKPINWAKIRQHCKKFAAIHSDNDPYVRLYHGEAFKKYLGARLIIERRKGHMTDEEGVKKLPSVIRSVLSF